MPRALMVAASHIQEEKPAHAIELLALLREHRWSDREIKSEAKMRLDRLVGSMPDDSSDVTERWGRGISLREVAEEVCQLL